MIVLYGASGYTGSLVAGQLVAAGARPVLAGRRRAALEEVARPLGLEVRVGGLETPPLEGADILLNCAGPFAVTQPPLLRASIARGIHYLDLAGEVDEHLSAAAADPAARTAGSLVMPGIGFGIIPSDGLLASVVSRLPDATYAELSLKTVGTPSRGTTEVVLGSLRRPGVHRRGGILRPRRSGARTTRIDFADGDGPTTVTTNPWRGDLASSVPGVADLDASMAMPAPLRALMHVPHGSLLRRMARRMPDGPTEEQRAAGRTAIHVRAENAADRVASAVLLGPDAYTFTAHLAAAAAVRISELSAGGLVPSGHRLPSEVFGADFALNTPGVRRVKLH
ncbi:saccharopine dehydrogenase family protein [Microbacterium sp. DT81.1]|uniref:saccharopine dehydrogenase family protein n=1 Tax=Microbacterium sp. DT81.1 TaxID=3393413 RepID=UPI003CF38380